MSQLLYALNQIQALGVAVNDLATRINLLQQQTTLPPLPPLAPPDVNAIVNESMRGAEERLRDAIKSGVAKEGGLLEVKIEQALAKVLRARLESAVQSIKDEIVESIEEQVKGAMLAASTSTGTGTAGDINVDLAALETAASELDDLTLSAPATKKATTARARKAA